MLTALVRQSCVSLYLAVRYKMAGELVESNMWFLSGCAEIAQIIQYIERD